MSSPTPPGDAGSAPDHWSHFDDGSLDELVPALEKRFGRRWGGVWVASGEPVPTIGIGLVTPTAEDMIWTEARARKRGCEGDHEKYTALITKSAEASGCSGAFRLPRNGRSLLPG